MENCGRCHDCGTKLTVVLDGEEWSPRCGDYRRYKSHCWAKGLASKCPDWSLERNFNDGETWRVVRRAAAIIGLLTQHENPAAVVEELLANPDITASGIYGIYRKRREEEPDV